MDKLKKYSPQFSHINDTLAFVVHLSFLTQNCKLVGLNEEQFLDDLGSIPQGWNKSNEIYQFRYIQKSNQNKNNKNKQTILVKILSMQQNELLISAIKQGKNDVFTLEINLNDHININKASKNLNQYETVFKDINGLQLLLNDQITHKLIPQKNDKEEKKDDDDKNKKKKNDDNPLIFPDPNPNHNPLLIGGGRVPGPFGGGGGFNGDFLPGPFGGGGNLMGKDQINQQFNNKNKQNPNANKPPFPGARFDPFGPGGNFPGGPDPDHFRPPRGGGGGGGGLGGFGGII